MSGEGTIIVKKTARTAYTGSHVMRGQKTKNSVKVPGLIGFQPRFFKWKCRKIGTESVDSTSVGPPYFQLKWN